VVEASTLPVPEYGRLTATLIDFGESFSFNQPRAQRITPMVYQAPESLLTSTWDYRIDIWSLGCAIFELVTGQSLFYSGTPDKKDLVQEWMAMFGNLPDVFAENFDDEKSSGFDPQSLSDWLHELYFDKKHEPEFAEEHIEWLGDLLSKMLRYKPEDRLTLAEVLNHRWFRQDPFSSEED
jgi:serine/threonine-protein kinase SRPK3